MPFIDQETKYDFGTCPFVFVKNNYMIIGSTAGSLVLDLKHPEYIFEDPFLLTDAQRSIDPSVVHIDLHVETEEVVVTTLDISKYNEMQKIVDHLIKVATETTKTSDEWSKLYGYKIIDPIGWDKENYRYSWYKERITREEFELRAHKSTVRPKVWLDKEENK